jgi:uncharacterized membrane protein (UPF0127 family)
MLGVSNAALQNPLPVDIQRGQLLRVINHTRSSVLARELLLALAPWSRLRGLLARPPLAQGQGMLIRPCRSVHTFFMGYPIDLLFLDAHGKVVELLPGLRPWRISPLVAEADCVLELPAGTVGQSRTIRGDLAVFEQTV